MLHPRFQRLLEGYKLAQDGPPGDVAKADRRLLQQGFRRGGGAGRAETPGRASGRPVGGQWPEPPGGDRGIAGRPRCRPPVHGRGGLGPGPCRGAFGGSTIAWGRGIAAHPKAACPGIMTKIRTVLAKDMRSSGGVDPSGIEVRYNTFRGSVRGGASVSISTPGFSDRTMEESVMSGTTEVGARPRRSRKLTPHEQRARWAEDGDVESLWGVLAAGRWDLIVDMEQVFSLLLKAITVRAERDPAGFAAETFTRMIGFNTYLLMRSQMYINLRLGQHGRSTRALGRPDFSLSAVAELIPGLLELQRVLAETMAAEATTSRAHELARAKRIENDRAEGVKAGARKPAPRGHAVANGAAEAMSAGGNGRLTASPGYSTARDRTPTGPRTMTTTTSRSHRADLEHRWAAIKSKLEAHADDLATQGVLVSRVASGRKVWKVRLVVRVGCRRVHRAIYVGGDDQPELSRARCPAAPADCIEPRAGAGGGGVAAFARFAGSVSGLARRLPSEGSLRRRSRGVDQWGELAPTRIRPDHCLVRPRMGQAFRGRRPAFSGGGRPGMGLAGRRTAWTRRDGR